MTSARRRRDAETSLLQRAWIALENGPVHSTDLAKQVMGIDGHTGAAAAAVLALLGADDRFHGTGDGLWSIRPRMPRPGTPLSRLAYAVVDVETTGGRYEHGHRITDVAVVEIRDGAVAGRFRTLVNPGRRIQPTVVRMTGITDEMVAGAPAFDEIAQEVFRRIAGHVFVAHNVAFDWGWLRSQLGDTLGDVPEVERLCTVDLSRRLCPGLGRHDLSTLSQVFRVPVHDRHRAYGDALATARILLRLLDRAGHLGIGDLRSLKKYRSSKKDRNQGDLFGGVDPAWP